MDAVNRWVGFLAALVAVIVGLGAGFTWLHGHVGAVVVVNLIVAVLDRMEWLAVGGDVRGGW